MAENDQIMAYFAPRKVGLVVIFSAGVGLFLILYFLLGQQPTKIEFSKVGQGYSLVAPPYPQHGVEPSLIVVTGLDDLSLDPYSLPEPAYQKIVQIDFESDFLALVRINHTGRGSVNSVVRSQDNVIITKADIKTIGPGNYVLDRWTQPYEFILIQKERDWGRNIHFILQWETQGIIGEADHYIP